MDMETDTPPKELRLHIRNEGLSPGRVLFDRSNVSIAWYIAIPHLAIAIAVLIGRLDGLSVFATLILCFPILLAAQRCLQTLVHDLSHGLISKNPRTNDLLGDYLVAGWIGATVAAYRRIHLRHHKHNGSAKDPEHISFDIVRQRGGLLRHCLRYVAGFEVMRLARKYYGGSAGDTAREVESSTTSMQGKQHIVVCQVALAAMFWLIADAWYLYALWLYMAVTWNPMLSNLRFLVEHPGESDLTVSTPAGLIERLYFAPFNFNYHLEHHLWPGIPPYKLALTHEYLKEHGYFERHPEFLGSSYARQLWSRK